MKYIVLVGDGMADYPIEELDGKTPLEAAHTPNMDFIAQNGRLGRIRTIPDKMIPGSDVAAVSIFGYDPSKFYTGRGPLEAANLGVELEDGDVAFRANLITTSGDTLIDYSAGHIRNKEAAILMKFMNDNLSNDRIKFYPGVSYRNLMVVKNGVADELDDLICKPPHDIAGQSINKNMPRGRNCEFIKKLMQDSRRLLESHEINLVRLDLKENPANMLWLWGQGKKPDMPSFQAKYGLTGSVISAVDLIKGFGRILGLEVINVEGATGYYDTNYEGKAKAALSALRKKDFVFVHVEAPDEAGHNGDLKEKLTAIERFDNIIVGTILKAFKEDKNFRMLVLPDHATPVSLKTHTADAIPFGIYGVGVGKGDFLNYSEKESERTNLVFEDGYRLMEAFIKSSFEV